MSTNPPRITSTSDSEFRHEVWDLHVAWENPRWRMTRRDILLAIKNIATHNGRTTAEVIDALNEAEVVFQIANSRFVRSSMSVEEWLSAFPEVRS
ncbi:MAG: hypothetical protein FJX57_02570 [Alphaproteobacteria bacterium]|nr:hypothetical protein [Alphaproteobacteria bacterium]